MTTPQGRYRIEERGRRLVTIDTLTGKEVNSPQGNAGIEDVSPRAIPIALGRGAVPVAKPTKVAPKMADRAKKPAGEPRAIPDFELPSIAGMGRSGRKAIVVAGAIFVALTLFATSLWVLLVMSLVFSADVRKLLFTTAPQMARTFIDGK
jgi:hypothetical protein